MNNDLSLVSFKDLVEEINKRVVVTILGFIIEDNVGREEFLFYGNGDRDETIDLLRKMVTAIYENEDWTRPENAKDDII
jgi:hypothetical protein